MNECQGSASRMNENELHDELAEINSRMHALDGNVLWINEKVTHDEPLTLFHAALGLMAQGNCDLTLHKEGEF